MTAWIDAAKGDVVKSGRRWRASFDGVEVAGITVLAKNRRSAS